jgi:hypothetical protein
MVLTKLGLPEDRIADLLVHSQDPEWWIVVGDGDEARANRADGLLAA